MAKFIIEGGKPLQGAVRLGGAKNAGFKLMIAAMLGETESRLLNMSHIGDVDVTERTMKSLGVEVRECGERTIYISPKFSIGSKVPQFSGEKSRASTLFASVLLALTGEASIPQPGGCVLGARPIDRHLEGLEKLGAHITTEGNCLKLQCQKLRGVRYRFEKKTHTGTEALILAAVKAEGETVLENAGQEPEIDDLITFLNKMGAKISREPNDVIRIEGVEHLLGAIHQVMPDRNEAVSYGVAALATKGDIVVENARECDLTAFLEKVEEAGGRFEIADYGVRFWYDKPLRATSITTQPHPGFMTDWQPLWSILMTQAQGTSEVIERVHFNRFQFIPQLKAMGAAIDTFNPEVDDSHQYYEFNPDIQGNGEYHGVRITGITALQSLNLTVPDLRAGATLVIAALTAPGRTELEGIEHIDRGYEDLDERLTQLGATISRAA